jgi:hypothetical protein
MLGVVGLAFAVSSRVATQEAEDVFVNDSRPLAAAIKEFAKRCHCVITYEDVKWGRDQVEASAVLRRQSDGVPAMIPRGTPFIFTVSRNLAQMSSKEIAQRVRVMMGDFERSQNPGQFKLVRGQTSLHVLPVQSAILEKPISVEANDIPAVTVVQAALDEVGRLAGEKVGIWTLPVNLLKQPIRVTVSSQPGYEVLSHLVTAVDKRLSWHLFYDVNVNSYFLTIYLAYQ